MARCPTPWKPRHPSPQVAYRAAGPDQEHYRCPGCGLWHVTTKAGKRARNVGKTGNAEYGRSWKAKRAIRKQFRRTGGQRAQ